MAPMRLRVPLARRLAVMVDMSGGGPIARVRTGGLLAAVVAILAVIAVVLAGCGGSTESLASKPAAEILAASQIAAREASAVHVKSQYYAIAISVKSKAKGKPETKLVPVSTIELQLTGGDGGRARLVRLRSESETIRVGNTLYVKGSPALYRSLARRTGAHVARGRWLKAPVNGTELREFAFFTESGGELALLLRNPTLSLTKGKITTIKGQKAIELKMKGKLYTGAIYIAATGKPYPIEIVKHGQETGQTTFTGWNQPVTLNPPANAVELSPLKHKGR